MGVEALDSMASPTNSSTRARPGIVDWDQRVACGCVASVAICQRFSIDLPLCGPHAAGRFQAADSDPYVWVNEPVTSWHGRPVAEERLVDDHDRLSVLSAHRNDERTSRVAA